MIYALLDKNIETLGLIYFSDKTRSEEELECTELLYTSDIVNLEDVKLVLRPWIALEINKEKDYYRNVPEIKEFLETGKLDVFYTRITKIEAEKEIESFLESWKFLRHIGCLDDITPLDFWINIKDKVLYDCDIYNYLGKRFTRSVVDIVYSYESLNNDEKKLLKEFSEIKTRDKKYEYLKKNLSNVSQNVLDFLPLWYRLSFKISKNKTIQFLNNPEYKNTGSLGGDRNIDKELKEKFIQTFKLGTVYSGPEIKSMIKEIYENLGVNKTPKISDLQNYFVITNVSNISSYRIDLRK